MSTRAMSTSRSGPVPAAPDDTGCGRRCPHGHGRRRPRRRGGQARPAQRWWRDTDYDAEAKGPVIGEIMGRAEAWAEETGWRLD
ncbi:MAG: hypothetical protein ABSG81_07945 [Acidimicrobiales bacterium]